MIILFFSIKGSKSGKQAFSLRYFSSENKIRMTFPPSLPVNESWQIEVSYEVISRVNISGWTVKYIAKHLGNIFRQVTEYLAVI